MSRNTPAPISIPPTAPTPAEPQPAPLTQNRNLRLLFRAAPVLLTPIVLLVSGYHPFAGDAGIYVAGILHILNPALYPLNAAFVTAFTHLSLFAWIIAALVRLTHLPLAWILLSAHLASIWLYLHACRRLAERLFPTESPLPAILLAAACATLPVAGTALVLMDPYVTARSFSTPLSLLALAVAMRLVPTPASAPRAAVPSARRWLWIHLTLFLAATCLLHPLMGLWTVAFLALYLAIAGRRTRLALTLCSLAILAAGLVFLASRHTPIAPAYVQAVSLPERSFLFLARWHWYEIAGLVLPLLLFGTAARRLQPYTPARALALTCVFAGGTALVIAALFVPPRGPYPLAPIQILRIFCLIYASGVVLISGLFAGRRGPGHWARPSHGRIANRSIRRWDASETRPDPGYATTYPPVHTVSHDGAPGLINSDIYAEGISSVQTAEPRTLLRARWSFSGSLRVLLLIVLFVVMFLAQRLTWPGSPQIESPSAPPRNPYQQAFLWIRTHTPPSAVFAFDPGLVYLPHEDEQSFRALTLRDHLADDKDAGIVAVLPRLATRWATQRYPELSVDQMTDAQRPRTLVPLGATWLLLSPSATTRLPCPYRNRVAQVCRLISGPASP